jgi:two-component system sensor histidine kinase KdpD
LTSIKAATTSLLADRRQPEATQTELLKVADEEADHLKELIDSALELAKLDESHIDVRPTVSDLGRAVQEVLESMRATIDGRPIQVTSTPRVPAVPFDSRLTKLAIKQVLDNALKYSPPETPIELQMRADDDGVSLEITDRGTGIPPQEQGKVFQRFYRSPAVEKRIPGSGLGLSIAHRILQAHRGDLTVTSEPGKTTFRLTLPLSSSSKESH